MRTRTELIKRMADAERHIELGDNVIERQRRMVAKLSGSGHDTMQAEQLLDSLERIQEIRLSEMDGLRNALANFRR